MDEEAELEALRALDQAKKSGDLSAELDALRMLEDARADIAPLDKKEESGSLVENIFDVALEGISGVNRAAAQGADFFLTDPVNSVLEISGSKRRIPSINNILSPATTGNFMETGLGRDVVQSGAEVGTLALAPQQALRMVTKNLSNLTKASESTISGIARQLAEETLPRSFAVGGLSGGGAEAGEYVGGKVGGEDGRKVGQAIGSIVSPVGVQAMINSGKNLLTSTARNLIREGAPTIDGLKRSARRIYEQIQEAGGYISGDDYSSLTNKMRETAADFGADLAIQPQALSAMQRFINHEGDISPTEIDTLRRVLGAAAQSSDKADRSLAREFINDVDSFLDDVTIQSTNQDVSGLYRDARNLWSRASKSEILEEAFYKSSLQATGDENGLRNQFRSILNNRATRRKFSREEIKAMEQVVQGTTPANIAKWIGKLGLSTDRATNIVGASIGIGGGSMIGGPVGAIAVPIIGTVSKRLAERLTKNNAKFADAVIRAGTSGQRIVDAYLKNTPIADRKPQELAQLLARPQVKITDIPQVYSREITKLIDDSGFYVNYLNQLLEKEDGR